MSFETLALSPKILRALKSAGYTKPTMIQARAIPMVFKRRDLLAGAQTGTGKTAAFLLPILQMLSEDIHTEVSRKAPIKALIIAPTRELVEQIHTHLELYAKYLNITSACVYGGVKYTPQIKTLETGVDILVATPGRLMDLISKKHVHLSKLQFLVLDEADRMLDMGFVADIKYLMKLMPKKRQNLLFWATYTTEVKKLANTLLNKPEYINVAQKNSTALHVEHILHPVEDEKRDALLSYLIGSQNMDRVLVFARTQEDVDHIYEQLTLDGLKTMALHGSKKQGERKRALEALKKGTIAVLVATDIAARGIDIEQLPFVINYALPLDAEDYVHRVGRTGRAGVQGKAISLVSVEEIKLLRAIEQLIKQKITPVDIKGFELGESLESKASHKRRKFKKPIKTTAKKGQRETRVRKKREPLKSKKITKRSPRK